MREAWGGETFSLLHSLSLSLSLSLSVCVCVCVCVCVRACVPVVWVCSVAPPVSIWSLCRLSKVSRIGSDRRHVSELMQCVGENRKRERLPGGYMVSAVCVAGLSTFLSACSFSRFPARFVSLFQSLCLSSSLSSRCSSLTERSHRERIEVS